MKPVKFTEQTIELQPPPGMKDCDPLPIFRDGRQCISKWRLGFRERLSVLFGGHIWLWVVSGNTQPPVALTVKTPFVNQAASKA